MPGNDEIIAARVEKRLRAIRAAAYDTGWWRLTVDVPVHDYPKGEAADELIREWKNRGYRVKDRYVAATRTRKITPAMEWLAAFLEREGFVTWVVICAEGAKEGLSESQLRRARERLGCLHDKSPRRPSWHLPPIETSSIEDLM